MAKRWFALIFIVFGGALAAHGQSARIVFDQASAHALGGKWEQCRLVLKPHLFPPPDDTLAPHMLHLYALASEKTGDRPSAIVTEEKIRNQYPEWSGKNESTLFSGELALKQRRYRKAFSFFSSLPPALYDADLRILLDKSSVPADTVNAWKQEFGGEPKALFDVLASLPVSPIQGAAGAMKVGVVLPFQIENHAKLPKSPAADFYRGMMLASEVLRASDSTMELYPFDTRGNAKYLNKQLDQRALNGLDVVIGPLRAGELQMLADWSKTSKTPCINPLSQHCPEHFGDPFFMQQPDFATVARTCFEFIAPLSSGSKVGIVYGPEKNDSLQADAYRTQVRKMGREVVLFKKVGKNSAANLSKFLFEAGLDSTCHLFVPNSEPLVRGQLLGAYGWIKAKYPILVVGKWLEANSADFEEWARNPIWFATNDLPDLENPNRKNWADSYKAKWGTPANWIAWKGFDLTLTLARSWYRHGESWAASWKSGEGVVSELFGQYRFTGLQPSNQYVPIYRVEGKEIKRVWPK